METDDAAPSVRGNDPVVANHHDTIAGGTNDVSPAGSPVAGSSTALAAVDRLEIEVDAAQLPTAVSQNLEGPSVFFDTPIELKGVLLIIQDRVDHQILVGSDFLLSFHGRERAKYMLLQAKTAAKLVFTIESAIDFWKSEREHFIAAFEFRDPTMTTAAQSICKSYETIHEIFARNLMYSFRSEPTSRAMKDRFPQMWRWTNPPLEVDSELRKLRNASSHRAGVGPVFGGDHYAELPNRDPFDAGLFWDKAIMAHVPSMTDELSDLIVLLERDLPSMPEPDPYQPSPGLATVGDYPIPRSFHALRLKAGYKACNAVIQCTDGLERIGKRVFDIPNRVSQWTSRPVRKKKMEFYHAHEAHVNEMRARIHEREGAKCLQEWERPQDEEASDVGGSARA